MINFGGSRKMFLPKVLIANKKFCIQREKIWSEKNLHAVKSWSCWNSDGDNFLVFAIVTDFFPQQSIIITFRSINSDGSPPTFQMSWGLLLTETWPDPDKVQFYLIASNDKIFSCKNKLAEPHWVGTFINETALGSVFICPRFSLAKNKY